jgi:uncharacterized membrane protein (UPF0127 family)
LYIFWNKLKIDTLLENFTLKNVIKEYLEKINMFDYLLSKYKNVITYQTENDITTGLLRFNKPPKNTIFLFLFPKEEILEFHTIGMKFSINIYFFNSQKQLVSKYINVKPNTKLINSKNLSKYVIEETYEKN